MALTLVIGNKNYSSWSFRPWIAMKVAGIPFDEVVISLDATDFKPRVSKISGTGKVPSYSTVRDHPRQDCRGGGGVARGAGRDGGRRVQVAVPDGSAVLAGHGPTGRFGDLLAAGGAGRGRATFVDEMDGDPGEVGLVPQHRDRPADLPLP